MIRETGAPAWCESADLQPHPTAELRNCACQQPGYQSPALHPMRAKLRCYPAQTSLGASESHRSRRSTGKHSGVWGLGFEVWVLGPNRSRHYTGKFCGREQGDPTFIARRGNLGKFERFRALRASQHHRGRMIRQYAEVSEFR